MNIRVTGILIQQKKILVLHQKTGSGREWSLPGGKVEESETLADALIREMREETGLSINLIKLLYVCDFFDGGKHIVHITFLVEETGGVLGDILGKDSNEIKEVKFVPISNLNTLGFSQRFASLVANGFPGTGSYMGPKSSIGL